MPRTIQIILLTVCVLMLAAPCAFAKNDLELFGTTQTDGQAQVKSLLDGEFNLVVEEFSGPATAYQGEDISGAVTLTFRNEGPDAIIEPFMARIYLAESVGGPVGMDSYVYWTTVPQLEAGETWVFDGSAIVPFTSLTGQVLLVAEVDINNRLAETNEADNLITLDFTVTPTQISLIYYEDFQDGDGGWIPRDLTEQEIHLQHTYFTIDELETTYGVWWCGGDDPLWGTPPGYGSSWDQRLTKRFTPMGEEGSLVTYAIQYDTEIDSDQILVEVSDNNGGTFETLAVHYGSSDGVFEEFWHDISMYDGQEILLRFRFVSDGSWDDEAGNLDTDGAFRLDFVDVSGYSRDDFEEGGDGWTPSAADPVGGEFRLVSVPDFTPGLPGDVYENGEPATTCNAWVAYDPNTLEFPDASPTERAEGRNAELVIESPTIELPDAWSHVLLSFDVYQDLPLENGIYYRYFVSSDDGAWNTNGRIYFGTEGWVRPQFDITDEIPPGATSIKVRLAANDFGFFWGWDPPVRNAAPFFDNVEILASESSDPGLDPVFYPRACGWSVDDIDGDGVYDVDDLCPTESAAFFDRDGDGCIDPVTSARHVEYWSEEMFPLTYVIHEDGAPGISDGSDFTAIQNGFHAWTEVPGADITVEYLGTTANPDADALDMVNTVTFADPDFKFPSGVLAVGLSTSYLTPVVDGDRVYRPGQIIDSDMIFNPAETFGTPDKSTGVDIRSIVTHEAGHMLGLSHSAVPTSTMFFVLPPGTQGSVLSTEDRMAMFGAYPNEVALQYANQLKGTIVDGQSGIPVGGVIVYAIEALDGGAFGDTTACDFTLPQDGSYHFAGLPDGDYFVGIHALDGSSEIGYIQPANINQLIYNKAQTLVVPEFWDVEESSTDDSEARDSINLSSGMTAIADITTNIDDVGPVVVSSSPADGEVDVAASTAVLVQFSEAVDSGSFGGNFNFTPSGGGDFVPGNAVLIHDDHTLMYVPSANLAFDTTFEVEVGGGVRDLFGNVMGDPFLLTFTTGPRPSVFIDNVTPGKAIESALVVINGGGFGSADDPGEVTLGGTPAPVIEWAEDRLLIAVPADLPAGPLDLVVTDPLGSGSATTLFTVLAPEDVARGLEIATIDLPGLPRVVDVSVDGLVSLVATDEGLAVIDVHVPGSPVLHFLPVAGGLNDLDVSPDGSGIYGVSTANEKLYRYQYDASIIPPANPVTLLNEIAIGDVPRGIVIDPSGKRAYLTMVGEIQVWDINPASATHDNQVGSLSGPGPVLLGPAAMDPGGRYLTAVTGVGEIAVFDPREAALIAEIPVQTNPMDIQIDPAGATAYVTDDNGYLSVVDMIGMTKVEDILTGGSLQGAAVTPTASFIYAANHQADDLDVIDLRTGSATHHGVATRIPTRINPVDVAFSSDGVYAYSLVELERKFVITAMGAGPLLQAVLPAGGPAGTRVVLSGSGFTGATVSFNGMPVAVDQGGDDYLAITIPEGAVTGFITVVGATPGEISNSIQFNVLEPDPGGVLSGIGTFQPMGGASFSDVVAVGSDGRTVAVGGEDGFLYLFDSNPGSSGYRQFHAPVSVFVGPVSGLAMSPDGLTVYAAGSDSDEIKVVDINADNESFGEVIRTLVAGGEGLGQLATSPLGTYLLAADAYDDQYHLLNLDTGNAQTVPVPGGPVGEMVFHPGGLHAYLAVLSDNPASLVVVDMNPASEGFGGIMNTVILPAGDPDEIPVSLSCTPDGSELYVMASQFTGTPARSIVSIDITDPGSPGIPGSIGGVFPGVPAMDEQIRVSPAGDRLVFNIAADGIYQVDLAPISMGSEPDVTLGSMELAMGFSPDGSQLYVVDVQDDSLHLFDFDGDRQMSGVWGDGQTGVAGETLPSPLRVRVTDLAGEAAVGVAVTFSVTGGDGSLTSAQPLNSGVSLTLATDIYGYAQVDWTLGAALGAQEVTVTSPGASGSPLVFAGTAIEDPDLLPLVLVQNLFYPLDGAADVSVTTAIKATFSRAVDVVSIHPDSYFLWDQAAAMKVPTVIGFADGNRTVSLTPLSDLLYGTAYSVVVGTAVQDEAGGPLTNSTDISFTTAAAPPAAVLSAVNPNSATPLVDVVLSGTGFDPVPANNQVIFVNGETMEEVTAYVAEGATDYLRATVPIGSWVGSVYVTGPTGPSNAVPFTVLEESSLPVDDELGEVDTGAPVKAVAVTPDGAMAYALSPEADLVVPVDLVTLASLPAIPVGDEPWAIAVHPAGTFVYVANRMSSDVSVIDVLPGSPTYQSVVATMHVGIEPVDLVVTPTGDRVIVVNSGSDELSIIDSDETSASFHNVISTVRTGTPMKTVTVTPDGTRIYVGTDTGYLVLGTLDYGVIGRVTTGTATKTLTVTPDGTLLVLLNVTGEITIYDIAPGSETENQVIASVRTGTGAKTATVSPDGALLYVVMEEDDLVLVFDLDVGASIGVRSDWAVKPIEDLLLIKTMVAGENPEALAFLGDGTCGFVVSNSGDNTLTVFGGYVPGFIAGRVYADCPDTGTGLSGVKVDIFLNETGDLFTTLVTDTLGYYGAELPAGEYNATLLTPLGYVIDEEVVLLTIGGGNTETVDWLLDCQEIIPDVRPMSYWKHAVATALLEEKDDGPDAATLCQYLDTIESHFNNHAINQVVVYDPPPSDECVDKLLVAKDLLNLQGFEGLITIARQQTMSVLFNVASGRISLLEVVSEDGATLSRAITYLDILIDDGVVRNDLKAIIIAKLINYGWTVPAGLIPTDLPDISYLPRAGRTRLDQNFPNPFNPKATIRFEIGTPEHVRIKIYDVRGVLVRTLVDEPRPANAYVVVWDGTNDHGGRVASGVYFCRMTAGKFEQTHKMMLLK